MTVALLLGSGQMFAQQAAVSAALVATLQPPTDGVTFARALDALIGGGDGAARQRARAAGGPGRDGAPRGAPVLLELAAVLEDVAAALEARDVEAVQAALDRAPRDRRARARLRGGARGGARDGPAGPAAPARARAPSSPTPPPPRRSTSRSATSACSRAASGGRSTSRRTSRRRSSARCATSPRRSARSTTCSASRTAPPRPSASPRCAPPAQAAVVLAAHRQHVGHGRRRPDPLDGGRHPARLRDVLRGRRRRRPRGRAGGGGEGGGVGTADRARSARLAGRAPVRGPPADGVPRQRGAAARAVAVAARGGG